MSSVNQPAGSGEAPTRLRGLPGYQTNSPDFLASRLSGATTQPSGIPQTPIGVGQTRPTPPPSKPYQSRERVYYQSPLLSSTNGKSGLVSSSSTAALNSASKPLSEAELKAEAPPTGSLYDDPLSPDRRPVEFQAQQQPQKQIEQLSNLVAASTAGRVLTGSHLDFPSASTDPLDAWVTVFGFSGSQAPAVLSYFQTLGTVIKTELGQRNWLHIQYDSPWAAQKALLKNGSVLPAAGSCMIGVLPTKKAVDQVGLASTSFMSPLKKGAESAVMTPFGATVAAPAQSSLRVSIDASAIPQTPGFPKDSMYSTNSTQPGQPTPTQTMVPPVSIFANQAAKEQAAALSAADAAHQDGSDGLVTRAFNYLFGF